MENLMKFIRFAYKFSFGLNKLFVSLKLIVALQKL